MPAPMPAVAHSKPSSIGTAAGAGAWAGWSIAVTAPPSVGLGFSRAGRAPAAGAAIATTASAAAAVRVNGG